MLAARSAMAVMGHHHPDESVPGCLFRARSAAVRAVYLTANEGNYAHPQTRTRVRPGGEMDRLQNHRGVEPHEAAVRADEGVNRHAVARMDGSLTDGDKKMNFLRDFPSVCTTCDAIRLSDLRVD